MHRIIVGTAGHIDHGKTRLVEALTGTDCDRWIEEKERGITIDLGFAVLQQDDFQIGFIDVPGHERFVHNALAGLGGIRLALLVVAADEGVKPQTREHLEICRLLEIPACLVALTKRDLVDDDVVELARLEVEDLLASTSYARAPILPVSARTGDGIPELKRELVQLARQHEVVSNPDAPVRMPIDRAFHLKGLGVVVTGTLVSGCVHAGDTLNLLPGDGSCRVRSIQVHGAQREVAEAGERTALQLTGVALTELHRGLQLVTPGPYRTTRRLAGRLRLLAEAGKPLRGSTSIRFHLYSSEVLGRVRPLLGPIDPEHEGIVEIRLQSPVVAVRGDRFIVRRPSPAVTLAGGEILDPFWLPRRSTELPAALQTLTGSTEDCLNLWVREAAEAGTELDALAQRAGQSESAVEEALARLVSEDKLLRVPGNSGKETRWLSPAAVRRVAGRADRLLKAYFKRNRLATSIPKAELIEQILPRRAHLMAPVFLEWLAAEQILVVRGDQISRPGRSAELTGEESRLARDIGRVFEEASLQPPAPAEVCDRLGAKPQIFQGVVQYLLEQRRLTRLPGGLLISTAAVDNLIRQLTAIDWDRFTVSEFKERFGLTRKWAIPILEHLDSLGVTRRIGDQRLIVRRNP